MTGGGKFFAACSDNQTDSVLALVEGLTTEELNAFYVCSLSCLPFFVVFLTCQRKKKVVSRSETGEKLIRRFIDSPESSPKERKNKVRDTTNKTRKQCTEKKKKRKKRRKRKRRARRKREEGHSRTSS